MTRQAFAAATLTLSAAFVIVTVSAQAPSTGSTQPPPVQSETSKSSRFPDGVGKSALLKVCSECHGPESAVGALKTRAEWNKTLNDMAGYGAAGTDEEWDQILEYLVKHFSLIPVNKATAKELESTLDVPTDIADAILRFRDEHGSFKSIDDLKGVPGIDAAKVDARRDRFVF